MRRMLDHSNIFAGKKLLNGYLHVSVHFVLVQNSLIRPSITLHVPLTLFRKPFHYLSIKVLIDSGTHSIITTSGMPKKKPTLTLNFDWGPAQLLQLQECRKRNQH